MSGIKTLATRRSDLFWLTPEIITEEEGWNIRQPGQDLDDHIRSLCDSIKEIGVQEPLTIYMKGDIPVLTNGHCRLAAVRLAISEGADIKGVPVRVEERQVDDARRTLSLLTRNAGKPLSMIEQAIPVRRLLDYGWSDKEIAAKAGFSLSKVKDLIALCGADTEVKEMIDQGKVGEI